MNELAEKLFEEISRIPCINSHSHLMPEGDRLEANPDILEFFSHAPTPAPTCDRRECPRRRWMPP